MQATGRGRGLNERQRQIKCERERERDKDRTAAAAAAASILIHNLYHILTHKHILPSCTYIPADQFENQIKYSRKLFGMFNVEIETGKNPLEFYQPFFFLRALFDGVRNFQ